MCESIDSGYHSPNGPLVKAQIDAFAGQPAGDLRAVADEGWIVVIEKPELKRLAVDDADRQQQTTDDRPRQQFFTA